MERAKLNGICGMWSAVQPQRWGYVCVIWYEIMTNRREVGRRMGR